MAFSRASRLLRSRTVVRVMKVSGFVRSVPYEAAPANVLPFRGAERLWEAHDLIVKAWTTHEGPFNFEGRWFHARQINEPQIWR